MRSEMPELWSSPQLNFYFSNQPETREGVDKKTECFLRISGKSADLDAAEEIIADSPDFDLKAWDLRFMEEIPRELRE